MRVAAREQVPRHVRNFVVVVKRRVWVGIT
jgi:hypothetical protein